MALSGLPDTAAQPRLDSIVDVFHASADAMFCIAGDARVTFWNKAAERLVGRPAATAIGDHARTLYPRHRWPEMASVGRRIGAGETVTDYETELVARDNQLVAVRLTIFPVRESGTVAGAWVIARDISEERITQATLVDNAARLNEAQALAKVGLWSWDADFGTMQMSEEMFRIAGIAPHDFSGRFEALGEMVHPDDVDAALGSFRRSVESGQPYIHQFRLVRPDGEWRWLYVKGEVVQDSAGRCLGMRGIAQDVTERERAEIALRRNASSLRLLQEVASSANEARSLEGAVQKAIREIRNHTGWIEGRIAERSELAQEASNRRAPAWSADPVLLGHDGYRSGLALPVCIGSEVVTVLEFRSNDSAAPDEQLLQVLVTAGSQLARVAERERAAGFLAEQATHDHLTGLPNRVLFLDRLAAALRAGTGPASRVAVLFIDLDGFKLVNDSLGHASGDRVLAAQADRITSALPAGATVARFGGDEFTVVCEGLADESDIVSVVERISEVIARPMPLDNGAEAVITASIGVVFADSPLDRPEDLLRDADVAMYVAKGDGRNRYRVFDGAMRARATQTLQTVNQLRGAAERGELVLYYQPQYALDGKALVGYEALVRWQHPERGLLGPLEFIPIAEESGLINAVGRWVIEEACRQAVEWGRTTGFTPKMAVNVSTHQLGTSAIVGVIAGALRDSDLDPACLCVEITESALMSDSDGCHESLRQIKALGVSIAIDDFGVGYSSLAYLQTLAADTIKIDKAFIDRLGESDASKSIVGAIVALGHAVGMSVIAEGIETAEQLQDLVDLGCDLGQGYFLGRPAPSG